MNSRLRFGIVRNQVLPWPDLLAEWRRYDALGFDSCWATDHFQRPSDPAGPHLDSWTVLAAVAACTERIRLGVLVSSNTFRHPSLLAKQAVSIDHISAGRLELGLGAGWFEPEHAAFGLDYPDSPERVARLAEAVEMIDLLMRQDVTTFTGHYYRLEQAPFRPAPVQRPRPPITLGAHGPRMLAITARFADRWNSYGSVEEIRQRGERLDAACMEIGRDPRTIVRSLYYWTRLLGADPWDSPETLLDIVGRYREAGIDEFIFEPPQPEQAETFERIATETLPALRNG